MSYSQGDPRQKIQRCSECSDPTERCEEDSIFFTTPRGLELGPLCTLCLSHLNLVYPSAPEAP